jgi:predicted regulator of Ras-like GTPase activity (Roadblock/LC7/MglB family)
MQPAEPTNLERIRQYGHELQRDPMALSFALLADSLREEGLLREAAQVCQRGLSLHPDYVTAYIVMGQISADLMDREAARAAFEVALRLEPHNVVARLSLSRLLLDEGRFEPAAEHLEHVLFLSPTHPEARELLAAAEAREAPARPSAEPDRESPEPSVPPQAEIGPGASVATIDSTVEELCRTPGVSSALLVHGDGLPVTGGMDADGNEETIAASVLAMYEAMRRYAERLKMGALRRAVVDGGNGKLVLAPAGTQVLMVGTESDAKLGLVNMQIDRALAALGARGF